MKKTILFSASIATLIACDVVKETAIDEFAGVSVSVDYMDKSIRPQDDFFMFANGTWVKNNPVPASESRWGSFNELDQANKEKLTEILDDAKQANDSKGSMNQILGDYYASFTNMEVRNSIGLSPIDMHLKMVNDISNKEELPEVIAALHQLGVRNTFRFGVGQDLKDVDNHTVYMGQGGIGLPNRDYYFDSTKADILEAYKVFVHDAMILAGEDENEATNISNSVVSFETKLAESMMRPAEMRNPEATYNKFSTVDTKNKLETFDFALYLKSTGIDDFDTMIVSQPEYLSKLASMYANEELSTWKNYLKWNVINNYAGHLNQEFVDLNFDFYGKTLSGKKEMKPINERAIDEITHLYFSELLGKAFVEKYYSTEAQERINTMVDNLLIVYRERINQLDWMSDETKVEALNKLNSIGRKLGFPSKWEDFSALDFNPETYIQNIDNTEKASYAKNMSELKKPVDKDEWGMPAHMVNAYYHPLLNEIAFPAGIMQPPFFSDKYEDAVNYGRIGMVIGHEFTHGFDDMGSQFAADGSFNNWWSPSDREKFESRTEKLGNTFASFCPIDGHCVNPQLTMGENIADLGGLTLAFHAYERTAEYKSGISREGYTPAQRFFIAYAQLWKINYTEEELKNRIANDPHSPGMYRVNGPLMNCPEFFEAFNVKETDAMRNPDAEVAKIW